MNPLFNLAFLALSFLIVNCCFKFYECIQRKRELEMDVVYATLIINGKKKFSDVPTVIKNKVKQVLIDLDLEELVQE